MNGNEIKHLIESFMFKLLGISKRNIDDCTKKDIFLLSNQKETIFYNKDFLFFHHPYDKTGYKIAVNEAYSNVNYQIERQVFDALLDKIDYCIKIPNMSFVEKEAIYKIALETELIASLLDQTKDKVTSIVELLQKLKLWSLKSYEGKKVPYAFIIDSFESGKRELNYLKFLDSDFSATITDGITSIISLDLECNFVAYNSIIKEKRIVSADLSNKKAVPQRFAQILSNEVIGKRLGIFLLTNGDIFLAKDSEILYVYRNSQWINFSGERYGLMLRTITDKRQLNLFNKENPDLFSTELFSTILDVSFSHAGGILAVVKKQQFIDSSSLSIMDDYSKLFDPSETSFESYKNDLHNRFKNEMFEKIVKKGEPLTEKQEKYIENEFEKRMMKRMAIETMLIDENGNHIIDFVDMNRKLRAELVGMDGATIIDENGRLISFGAIIQNDKGSSGGGRGAATSKLSNFGGFATKISTDGYIELYIEGEISYQIK